MRGLSRLIWAGLFCCATAGAQAPGPVPRDRFPIPGSRAWLKAQDSLQHMRSGNCPHSFDVLHYAIDLEIDIDSELIFGDVRVLSVAEEAGLTEITLDLAELEVDHVLCEQEPLAYVHDDPVLTVFLPQAYALGDTFEVEIIYHGHPGNEGTAGFGGFYFRGIQVMAFSMGVGTRSDPPSMGKFWFPCWDWPCDKATAEFRITVSDNRTAVCNGRLVEVIEHPEENKTTFVWSETHQIATHLMSVAARQYAEITDPTYDWVRHWVYPNQVENAQIHFAHVALMIDGFVERFGSYPFDKFGFVAAAGGDMEHQSCVTHLSVLIGPNHTYDWLLAHELAHMWWGDCVSINDWRDIWLSEGFATYGEALFHEHAYGMEAYHDYVQSSLMDPVFGSQENFPIYDPDYLWGTTTYEKAAVVLHMLRHVVGDAAFYAALGAYRQAHEYQNADTEDFQDAVEGASGRDLDWFFDEWIFGTGWPDYRYAWQWSGDSQLGLVIDQQLTGGPLFAMPVDVRISMAEADTLVTLWVAEQHESFTLSLPQAPTGVTLDPENWILNTAEQAAYASAAERPEMSGLWLVAAGRGVQYYLPRRQRARLELFDVGGMLVRLLAEGMLPAGPGHLAWDGLDAGGRPAASGVYFCRLSAEDGGGTARLLLTR